MNIDHQTVTALLEQTAEQIILPRWKNLQQQDITHKAVDDVVTIADREAEQFLSAQLPKLMPGSKVIGEEAAHDNPDIFHCLNGSSPVWVIDPLDGTGNFAQGDDKFAIMVCLIVRGETRAAWIYDPLRKTMTSAEKAAGAFANDKRLRLTPQQSRLSALSGALLTRWLPDHLRATAQAAAGQFNCTTMSRCGGYDYQAFASASVQFLFYYRTLIWDHAPGCLIAEEAGGIVRRLDGSPYHPTDQHSGLLVADSMENWKAVQQCIVPGISARI